MKILACQVSIPETRTLEDKDVHVRSLIKRIEQYCKNNEIPDLIVLPELSTIEYSLESFKRLDILGEDLNDFSFHCFSELAQKLNCHIAYGFPKKESRNKNGRYFITQSVISPDGKYVTHFDKLHIAQFGASEEKRYFSPGNKLGIFNINGCRAGIIICYDFRFPRLTSIMCEKFQLDLILHPVAFTRDATFESWHNFVITRALENQVYFLSLNRAGKDWGKSMFCPPWIDEITKPEIMGCKEEFRIFELDTGIIKQVRETYSFDKDRLKDYYILTP